MNNIIKSDDIEIKVIKAVGFNDGYYWDMAATVEIDNKFYSIQDAGSGSGYVATFSSCHLLTSDELNDLHLNKPTGAELSEIDFDVDNDDDDTEYIVDTIIANLSYFKSLNCKEGFEYYEADFYGGEWHVDGKAVDIDWDNKDSDGHPLITEKEEDENEVTENA